MAAGDLDHTALDESAKDEIGALARAFNSMVYELNRVSTEHERLVATERDRLESLVAERTQALEQSREMFRLIAESTQAIPFTLDVTRGAFPYIGAQGAAEFNVPEAEWREAGALDRVLPRASNPQIRQCLDDCTAGPFEFLASLQHASGRARCAGWARASSRRT